MEGSAMGDVIQVEVGLLRTAAGKAADVRDAINSVVTNLQSALAPYYGCWGSGELGRQFAGAGSDSGYLVAERNMLEGAQGFSGAFESYASGQYQSASSRTSRRQTRTRHSSDCATISPIVWHS
jgi:hypothetical protein